MFRHLASLALAPVLAAQTFPHAILTELPAVSPRAQIVSVDDATGAATALGGFPSDSLAPLAVARDPYDGDLVVALDAGAAVTSIVRLRRNGTMLTELPVATINGRVVDLAVADNDVIAVVDGSPIEGGIWRAPRRGGTATRVLALSNVTAMHVWDPTPLVLLAWTGRPGTAVTSSGVGLYDFDNNTWLFGPHSFPNPNVRTITGVVDLPTAIPRQLLSFDDGTFALFAGLLAPQPTPLATTVPIPAGGATALHPIQLYSATPYAVGNGAYPFLYEIDPFSGAVTMKSQALPGSPVDFAGGMPRFAHSVIYGQECGPTPPGQQWTNQATIGTTFSIGVTTIPFGLSLLVTGLDDVLGGTLPATLPNGCTVEVAPTLVQFLPADQTGVAFTQFVIPNNLALIGTVLHAQWLLYEPTGLQTGVALAHWIGT